MISHHTNPPLSPKLGLKRIDEALEKLLKSTQAVPLFLLYREISLNPSAEEKNKILRYLCKSKKYRLTAEESSEHIEINSNLYVEKATCEKTNYILVGCNTKTKEESTQGPNSTDHPVLQERVKITLETLFKYIDSYVGAQYVIVQKGKIEAVNGIIAFFYNFDEEVKTCQIRRILNVNGINLQECNRTQNPHHRSRRLEEALNDLQAKKMKVLSRNNKKEWKFEIILLKNPDGDIQLLEQRLRLTRPNIKLRHEPVGYLFTAEAGGKP